MANSEIATSTNDTSEDEYQVFLSFRGPDTRRGFTNILHQALVDAGIRVFIDDEDLRPGERISGNLEQAIDDSKLYIPIFSKQYASSHWCLRELAKMVENISKEDEKKVMFPIFYDVTPNDVKLKTKLYKDAISNLEQMNKFSSEDIETWRRALKEVGCIKGWEVEKYRGDAEIIQEVVQKVVLKLEARQRQVTGDLVGMEDQIADIKGLLDIEDSRVRLIGIYGMGGIGKTTLANIIFNQLCPHFGKNCCFLEDVRETTKTKGLDKLRENLLSAISNLGVAPNIANKKMLIVLDDVDKAEQIQKLIGEKSLYPGTRILVTTRDKSILKNRRYKYEFEEYEMMLLSEEDALKLFSRHAFNDDSPPDDYYTLSKGIVSTTGGLPLALEAIGSSLFDEKEPKIWEEWLEKLKKTPHENVLEKLKISYDALDLGQKQIFLDIACFFVRENKTNPMYVWKDCGYFPENAINVLIKRCMIKILYDDRFGMHDQFRDLGRAIAKDEGTRLWDKDDIISKLRSTKDKVSVQALRLGSSWDWRQPSRTITPEQIKRFPHMRFLWLGDIICQGDFTGCLLELKWIILRYPYSFPDRARRNRRLEATNLLHLENVVVVNLSGLDITEDVFESLIKGARNLKVLTLCYNASIHKTPTFPQYSVLEKLNISEFVSLKEIDCSIGKLTKLSDLSFEKCIELQKLPEQIGESHNLRHLSLKSCDSLSELPDSILKLERLTKLDVSCTEITRLPDFIDRLSRLSFIDISFTPIEKLPSTMSKLLLLKTLHLNNCDQLAELPKLPKSLTTLQLASTSLQTVPNLSCLTNLVVLALSDHSESMAKSDKIETCDLQWIANLSKLRKLQFCFSNVYAPTTELGSLSLLKVLTLHGADVPTFKQLPSELIVLELYDTRGKQIWLPPSEKETAIDSSILTEPEEIKAVRQLEKEFLLFHRWSEGFVHLREDPGCNELQAPELIDHWRGAFHFPSSLKMLQKFVLWGCPGVQDIEFVSTLKSLLVFSVGGCTSLKRLGGLSNLKNLMELTLNRCWSLQVVEGIDELEVLNHLQIEKCRSVGRILDPSSSKIPNKCSILITCSGELPDCGRTYDTWRSYREKILSGAKRAWSSETDSEDSEIETEDSQP